MKKTISILTVLAMAFLAGCGKPPVGEESGSTNAPTANMQPVSPIDTNAPSKSGDEVINNNPPAGMTTNSPAITNETDTNNPATTNQ
jgi:PBP1b-binding outer membrane lipoprotein LpoB